MHGLIVLKSVKSVHKIGRICERWWDTRPSPKSGTSWYLHRVCHLLCN